MLPMLDSAQFRLHGRFGNLGHLSFLGSIYSGVPKEIWAQCSLRINWRKNSLCDPTLWFDSRVVPHETSNQSSSEYVCQYNKSWCFSHMAQILKFIVQVRISLWARGCTGTLQKRCKQQLGPSDTVVKLAHLPPPSVKQESDVSYRHIVLSSLISRIWVYLKRLLLTCKVQKLVAHKAVLAVTRQSHIVTKDIPLWAIARTQMS